MPLAPDIGSAGALVSLAEACRVAKAAGDVQHYQRYRQALESGLQFLTTLQYTEANTQHFADWYRPALVGAFHASAPGRQPAPGLCRSTRCRPWFSILSYVADLP